VSKALLLEVEDRRREHRDIPDTMLHVSATVLRRGRLARRGGQAARGGL
jgi:hypothetical protein